MVKQATIRNIRAVVRAYHIAHQSKDKDQEAFKVAQKNYSNLYCNLPEEGVTYLEHIFHNASLEDFDVFE